ncbi:PAS domain S-box protein [Sinorhizobium garamanticum]|uniref:Blue-light-activated histidine kinase n=1 Tax=Sinorhizobium garamanticum TaxID=680247 RepID=A0ABY8DLY7_9HYPH|nr:PAS domain S-box protein [Sinorhizobium garamanticum]WEX89966.1 PAS domain S-box protein [Sinorhizobium garamanticum]
MKSQDELTNPLPLLGPALDHSGQDPDEFLQALPAAIYMTDAAGRITFYNEAAAQLWGMRPELGRSEFCGSWKLYWPDGTPLPHDQCPMALALRERQPIRDMEILAERPDGTRIPIVPYPTPIFDRSGALTGAINMLVDITERKEAERAAQLLAAIVEASDDAIVAKNLDGIIMSWNQGAERLFGYAPEEVIGKPITIIIPVDRHHEETTILGRLRRGERIDHYETIRRRKDGSFVEVSLTVSPVRNSKGEIIGASKIARDITERRRAEEQQHLLLREMSHRVKNLFALCGGIVTLSGRKATTPEELISAVRERFGALAQAHELTLPKSSETPSRTEQSTTLQTLIQTIASPFNGHKDQDRPRITVSGTDTPIAGGAVTSLALLFHEFATNAAKYGALSTPEGYVDIQCFEGKEQFILTWRERGGPPVENRAGEEGFGSLLSRATVKGQLGGEISREWKPEGLTIRMTVACDRLTG